MVEGLGVMVWEFYGTLAFGFGIWVWGLGSGFKVGFRICGFRH